MFREIGNCYLLKKVTFLGNMRTRKELLQATGQRCVQIRELQESDIDVTRFAKFSCLLRKPRGRIVHPHVAPLEYYSSNLYVKQCIRTFYVENLYFYFTNITNGKWFKATLSSQHFESIFPATRRFEKAEKLPSSFRFFSHESSVKLPSLHEECSSEHKTPKKTPIIVSSSKDVAHVIKQGIPKDYVEKTLIPHLESQIAELSHTFFPFQLVQLTVAYAKLPAPLRHRELASHLKKQIINSVDGFRPGEIVSILHPLYILSLPSSPGRSMPQRHLKLLLSFSSKKLQLDASTTPKLLACKPNVESSPACDSSLISSTCSSEHPCPSSTVDNLTVSKYEECNDSSEKEQFSTDPCMLEEIEVFEILGEHILKKHIFKEFSAINLLSIIRVYGNLPSDPFHSFIRDHILPLADEGLDKYDGAELSFILQTISLLASQRPNSTFSSFLSLGNTSPRSPSISHVMEKNSEMVLLRLVIPKIENKLCEMSSLHQISIFHSLARMSIFHPSVYVAIEKILTDERACFQIPAKYVSACIWSLSKFFKPNAFASTFSDFETTEDILGEESIENSMSIQPLVASSLASLIESNINRFSALDFARLSQALPENSIYPLRIAQSLQEKLIQGSMEAKNVTLFFLGCCNRGFLPNSSKIITEEVQNLGFEKNSNDNMEDLLSHIHEFDQDLELYFDKEKLLNLFLNEFDQNSTKYSPTDIERIIRLLKAHPREYKHLLKSLPEDWLYRFELNEFSRCI